MGGINKTEHQERPIWSCGEGTEEDAQKVQQIS